MIHDREPQKPLSERGSVQMKEEAMNSLVRLTLSLPVVVAVMLWQGGGAAYAGGAEAGALGERYAIEGNKEGTFATVECVLSNEHSKPKYGSLEIVKAPVAHYRFDGDATDSSANMFALDGIERGKPVYEAGRDGLAISLDGSGDYVECDDPLAHLDSHAMSITCWIKPDELGGERSLVCRTGAYAFKASNGHLRFTTPDMADYDGDSSILKVGVWQHVGVSFVPQTEGGLAFYIDGIQTDVLNSDDKRAGTGPTLIGAAQWPDELFDGQIDDVRIYDRVLTKEEITQQSKLGGQGPIPDSYILHLLDESKSLVRNLRLKEAATALEQKRADYNTWKATNLDHIESCDLQLPSDFYVLLAYARTCSGTPIGETLTLYKQAVSQPHEPSRCIPDVLLWLFDRVPTSEYLDLVEKCIRNSNYPNHCVYRIAERFEARGNWNAFQCFLDAVFLEADDVTSAARAVARGLARNGDWAGKFLEYCQDKPELARFLFYVFPCDDKKDLEL